MSIYYDPLLGKCTSKHIEYKCQLQVEKSKKHLNYKVSKGASKAKLARDFQECTLPICIWPGKQHTVVAHGQLSSLLSGHKFRGYSNREIASREKLHKCKVNGTSLSSARTNSEPYSEVSPHVFLASLISNEMLTLSPFPWLAFACSDTCWT